MRATVGTRVRACALCWEILCEEAVEEIDWPHTAWNGQLFCRLNCLELKTAWRRRKSRADKQAEEKKKKKESCALGREGRERREKKGLEKGRGSGLERKARKSPEKQKDEEEPREGSTTNRAKTKGTNAWSRARVADAWAHARCVVPP